MVPETRLMADEELSADDAWHVERDRPARDDVSWW